METCAKSLSFSLSLALSEHLSVSNRRDQTETRSRPAMRDQGPRARIGSDMDTTGSDKTQVSSTVASTAPTDATPRRGQPIGEGHVECEDVATFFRRMCPETQKERAHDVGPLKKNLTSSCRAKFAPVQRWACGARTQWRSSQTLTHKASKDELLI